MKGLPARESGAASVVAQARCNEGTRARCGALASVFRVDFGERTADQNDKLTEILGTFLAGGSDRRPRVW